MADVREVALGEGWAQRIGADELDRLEEALSDLGIRVPASFDAPGYFGNAPPG